MVSKLSEKLAIVATIDPEAQTASAVTSDWIDMTIFRRVIFIFLVGELGSSATVDGAIEQATDSGGSGNIALSPAKAITQLTEASTDDDKQAIIEVDASELTAGFTHIAAVLTTAVQTSDVALVALAGVPRYHPAADNDLASVDEIVS